MYNHKKARALPGQIGSAIDHPKATRKVLRLLYLGLYLWLYLCCRSAILRVWCKNEATLDHYRLADLLE